MPLVWLAALPVFLEGKCRAAAGRADDHTWRLSGVSSFIAAKLCSFVALSLSLSQRARARAAGMAPWPSKEGEGARGVALAHTSLATLESATFALLFVVVQRDGSKQKSAARAAVPEKAKGGNRKQGRVRLTRMGLTCLPTLGFALDGDIWSELLQTEGLRCDAMRRGLTRGSSGFSEL